MRGLLIGSLALAACYGPTVPSNVPCSPDQACPVGQFCVDQVCVGSPGGDAGSGSNGDRDGDEHADTADNCPDKANGDQLDEDGDGRGDACDSCPQLSDDGKDSDGDGVADACDPHGTENVRDSAWLFEGFHAGMPQWGGASGWVPAGDGDAVRAAGAIDTETYLDVPLFGAGARRYDDFKISIGFTIEASLGNKGPGIRFELYDETNDQLVYCEVTQTAGDVGTRRVELSDDLQLTKPSPFAWQTGTPYALTLAVRAGSYTCSVDGAGGHVEANGASTLAARNGAAVTLVADSMTVRLDWVFAAGAQ